MREGWIIRVFFVLSLSGYLVRAQQQPQQEPSLFPVVFNLATNARVWTNATCGQNGPEEYCKLVEHVNGEQVVLSPDNPQCTTCDDFSNEYKHPIEYTIDGSTKWWQSPSIANGWDYHYVTITLDLGQIFQVAYVIVKAANSPRPGNWILERSLDGQDFSIWQYYAMSDSECVSLYGINPTIGTPKFETDDQVICTSAYSKLNPLENGEIHTSLVNGRPSVLEPTTTLIEFTSARYVQLRFQRIRTLHADLMNLNSNDPNAGIDPYVTRRYFYSIKDISIGGQCICFGHARTCPQDPTTFTLNCECEHNTCGEQCQRCCPGYNQKKWKPGTFEEGNICEACNCNGHAEDCYYDEDVDARRESLNFNGEYEGGGVCIGCRDNTAGVNCEQCAEGFFRPAGEYPSNPNPCRACLCSPYGIRPEPGYELGSCVRDDSQIALGLNPGDCFCKEGYGGANCDQCAKGYEGFPSCRPCGCSVAGSKNEDVCQGFCDCKTYVTGTNCDRCLPGYLNLEESNPDGCTPCFCFGASSTCNNVRWGFSQITTMEGWLVTDFKTFAYVNPQLSGPNRLSIDHDSASAILRMPNYYWLAPQQYLGNKLASYGGQLKYKIFYQADRSAVPFPDIDVLLEGGGQAIVYRNSRYVYSHREESFAVELRESGWYTYSEDPARTEQRVDKPIFMTVLSSVTKLMIRTTHSTSPTTSSIRDVSMDMASQNSSSLQPAASVERCVCPPGYDGLSCESCQPGYRRTGGLYDGRCEPCFCNGHAFECEDQTGACLDCRDNTMGQYCDQCADGYYGDPHAGTPDDCQPCACPLLVPSNNFSPTCIADSATSYMCDQCPGGYAGPKCDRCADGFYGNPTEVNSTCLPCLALCNNNLNLNAVGNCNTLTGDCLKCTGNTVGPRCELCAPGYYGDAVNAKNCLACQCNQFGSITTICDDVTGDCSCLPNVVGPNCDLCSQGYWNLESGSGCEECSCDPTGSISQSCAFDTGLCSCKPGVTGRTCDRCGAGYYDFTDQGCKACDCSITGGSCDSVTGDCTCPPNTEGVRCDQCVTNTWGYDVLDGCKECNCRSEGAVRPDCDLTTGQCECRAGIEGQQCDRCQYGYHDFPQCRNCRCELGTEPDTCDSSLGLCECQDNGQCVCKENVDGARCDRCKADSFGLERSKPDGCTKCICFGVTSTCGQSDLVRDLVLMSDVDSGGMVITDGSRSLATNQGITFSNGRAEADAMKVQDSLRVSQYYWNLPQQFLGNKVTAYGGNLYFLLEFSGDNVPESNIPDVFIVGSNFTLVLDIDDPPANSRSTFSVPISEGEWEIGEYVLSHRASRQDVMMVLQDIKAILIRASFGINVMKTSLSDVTLEVGVEQSQNPSGYPATGVEQCACPPGYEGTSCERCASGYIRVPGGAYLGSCELCTCYGHATYCDDSTGKCDECQDNTAGDRCDRCSEGYYGNATQGLPDDCQLCACPRSDFSHSPTCLLDSDDGGLTCSACNVGYQGRVCDQCVEGFYGNPMLGEECLPCDCSQFGSLSDKCDNTTGQCSCIDNIYGRACDQCEGRYILDGGDCVSCDDTCTGLLLDDIEDLEELISQLNISGVAPWPKLREIENRTAILEDQLDDYIEALEVAENISNSLPGGVADLAAEIAELERRSEESKGDSSDEEGKSGDTYVEADGLEKMINDTFERIKNSVYDLKIIAENLAASPGQTNQAQLAEAIQMVNEMVDMDFTTEQSAADEEKGLADDTLDRALKLYDNRVKELQNKSDGIEKSMDDIEAKFNELIQNSHDANGLSNQTVKMNKDNQNTIDSLKNMLEEIDRLEKMVMGVLSEAQRLIDEANRFLKDALEAVSANEANEAILENILVQLRGTVTQLIQELPHLSDLVQEAENHARQLASYADDLEKLLESAREVAEKPLYVLSFYNEIISIINASETAANEAKEKAEEAEQKVSPDVDGSLVQRAEASKMKSDELDGDAKKLNVTVANLNSELDSIQNNINEINGLQNDIENGLNNLNSDMDRMNADLASLAEEASKVADDALATANKALAQIKDFNDAFPLTKAKMDQLTQYTEEINDNLDGAGRSLTRNSDNLDTANDLVMNLTTQESAMRALESTMAVDITDITEKIRLARIQANNIQIPLQSSRDELCIREYNPQEDASAIISMSVTFSTYQPDNFIMYFGGTKTDNLDFMALDIQDEKVHLQFNLGGDQSVQVTHDLKVTLNETQQQKWFTANVEIVSHKGYLTVFPAGQPLDAVTVNGSGDTRFTLLNIDDTTRMFIAGVPDNFLSNSFLTRSFDGCISEASLKGKNIGLYSFTNTTGGCSACTGGSSPSKIVEEGIYTFSGGSSYSEVPTLYFGSRSHILKLSFKTFSKDALLFYGDDRDPDQPDKKPDFIAIELRNGHLVYSFNLGSGRASNESSDTFNKGKFVIVDIVFENAFGTLRVTEEGQQPRNVIQIRAPPGSSELNLGEKLYFGGIPFEPLEGITNEGLDGCMKDLEVNRRSQEIMGAQANFQGVVDGCVNELTQTVGLQGDDSYLSLSPVDLPEDSSVFVSFSTTQETGLILAGVGKQSRKKRQVDTNIGGVYFAISLNKGRIISYMNKGEGEVSIKSKEDIGRFNDGKVHSIYLNKTNNAVRMIIDENLGDRRGTLPGEGDSTIDIDYLYIGGIGPEVTQEDLGTVKTAPLKGCVNNFLLNQMPIDLDQTNDYKNVDLGSCIAVDTSSHPPTEPIQPFAPTQPAVTTVDTGMTEAPPADSCVVPSYSTIPGTSRYGLTPNSHSKYTIDSRVKVSKKLDVLLDIQTVANNGLVLYISEERDFTSIQVVDGYLVYSYDLGNGPFELRSTTTINDGREHKVKATRDRRKGILTVDGNKQGEGEALEGANSLNIANNPFLYVGGIPADVGTDTAIGDVTESLSGCVRLLSVIGQDTGALDLTEPENSDVGECYTSITRGTFFDGNAYAILDENFKVSSYLKLEFEFRTSKWTGVLLSVQSSEEDDCLGIELLNGEIWVRVDNGEELFSVNYSPPSELPYSLCNNRWHKLVVLKSKNVIQLTVDDGEPLNGRNSGTSTSSDTKDNLYIGGFPDDAPEQLGLTTSEKFEGCIRNFQHELYMEPVKTVSIYDDSIYRFGVSDGCPSG